MRDPRIMEEPRIEFDREKLKDVIHYVCGRCEPAELGNVKLHKILYFADMLHFNETMRPLTGVEYLKQPFGPTARHLSAAVAELEREDRIRVSERLFYGYRKKDYVSLQPPRLDRIGNAIPLIEDVIAFVCSRTAKEISELSHNAPWQAAEIGEVLPYFTALGMEPGEVSDDDLAWATAEAERLKPEIESGGDAGHLF